MLKLPESPTPAQLAQLTPLMVRAILSADEDAGGFALPIDGLTHEVSADEITGEIRSGQARFAYRIYRRGSEWVRDIRVLSGVEEIEFAAEDAPPPDTVDILSARLQQEAAPTIDLWIEQIRQLGVESADLQDFADRLYDLYPELEGEELIEVMAQAQMTASWAGAAEAQGDSEGAEFAATQPKKKNCKTGKSCGFACIASSKQCLRELPVGARGAARRLARLAKKRQQNPSPDLPPDTVMGFSVLDTAWLDKALRDLEDGDNRENLGKLRQFVALNGTQVVAYGVGYERQYSSRQRTAHKKKLLATVTDYPSQIEPQGLLLKPPTGSNVGYTSHSVNNVVIRAETAVARDIDADSLKSNARDTIGAALRGESSRFTVAGGLLSAERDIATFLHELGHQIHYDGHTYDDTPMPPASLKRLSRYSETNGREYAAEHFVSWVLAPSAFRTADPAGYAWIEAMVDQGLQGKRNYDR